MPERITQVWVRVEPEPGSDDEEADELVRELLQDVLDTDVEAAELVAAGPAPEGSKGADVSTVTLAVTVFTAGVPPLLTMLHSWVQTRKPHAVIHLEGPGGASLDIPNVPLDRVQEIVAQWQAQPPASTGGEAAATPGEP
jgi:hypothetical protein